MTERFVRRRYIVDWGLQGNLLAHGLLYGGLSLVALTAGIFVPLLWNLAGGGPVAEFEEQAIVMLYMHERFWLPAFVCAVIVVISSVRLSHRIAGPLVRYKRNLRLLAAGKLPEPLRTRANDHLKEEVACLNEAVAGIGARVAAIRGAELQLRRQLANSLRQLPADQRAALVDVEAAVAALQQAVGAFGEVDTGDALRPAPEAAPRAAFAGQGGLE